MKKTVFILLSAIASLAAQAQEKTAGPAIGLHLPTQKGSFMIGSDILLAGYDRPQNGNAGRYSVGISPRAGYFVANNFAVGLSLDGSLYGTDHYHSYIYGAGVFARYYFGKAADNNGAMQRTRFFVEGGLGGRKIHYKSSDADNNVTDQGKFSDYNYYLMPGVDYFINKNIALEGGLNYSRSGGSQLQNADHLSLSIGVRVFLNKK